MDQYRIGDILPTLAGKFSGAGQSEKLVSSYVYL